MTHRIISSVNDDALAHYIGQRESNIDLGRHELHVVKLSEKLLLDGTHEELRKYFDVELAALRYKIDKIAAANREEEVIIEVGYSMTMLYAAYYAVLNCPNVTVRLHTPPAFGGDTRYAKTHPHVIQKLVYNVLLKANRVILPTIDSLQAILDVYPRLQAAVMPSLFGNHDSAENMPDIYGTQDWGQVVADLQGNGHDRFVVEALPLPDEFMPVYDYVRQGVAIFTNFEPGGAIDRCIEAWIKLCSVHPIFQQLPVTILGSGDHRQAGNIAVAFPSWQVILNPPIAKCLEAAGKAEVVVLPDDPPHAGPTRDLFAGIGAGAGIVAHEGSAAVEYAGAGVLPFSGEGDRTLALGIALRRAFEAPERTFGMMAATVERRTALRNVDPALYAPGALDSAVTEASDGR